MLTFEFTIATDSPIYNQYHAVFFVRRFNSEKKGLVTRLGYTQLMGLPPQTSYTQLLPQVDELHSADGLPQKVPDQVDQLHVHPGDGTSSESS